MSFFFSPLSFGLSLALMLFLICKYECIHMKTIQWTIQWTLPEKEYITRILQSNHHPVFMCIQGSILFIILMPSRIIFMSPLAPFFYTLYTCTALSMKNDFPPLWVYAFMCFYIWIMGLGTFLFLATMLFPSFKKHVNTFLHGHDMTTHFFGQHGYTHAKALLATITVQYIYHHIHTIQHTTQHTTHHTYPQLEKESFAFWKTQEDLFCLLAQHQKEDRLVHRMIRHVNNAEINKIIHSFFTNK